MFADQLRTAIDNDPDANPYYSDRIKGLLDAPDSLRKRVALHMLENHAAAHVKNYYGDNVPVDAAGAIDWSKIDWPAVLGVLLKILVALLPLLML